MTSSPPDTSPLSDEWCEHHFNYLDEAFAHDIHGTLARMRATCPVTHSDERGGFWAVTRYEDVLAVAQDWETYSSELGVSIPSTTMTVPAIPEHIDPPLQRVYKKLLSAWFTPKVVRAHEDATRALVTRLIDDFVEAGTCDFMSQFALPLPGLTFFDLVLNAPSEDVARVAEMAQRASVPTNPDSRESWQALVGWIKDFLATRREQPAKGDIVDAILNADIEGRPVTETEILGMVQLLILGGLETTAGILGQMMLRFIREPEIPALLRERPDLVPAAMEELLRLETSFLGIGRTVRHDTELGGHRIGAGEKVFISWASANRDPAEFPDPDVFDVQRESNRHLAFGAGPHRCVGSNLARMNLRIAIEELVHRLQDLELVTPEESLPFHTAFNRSPLELPIRFRPGPRVGPA